MRFFCSKLQMDHFWLSVWFGGNVCITHGWTPLQLHRFYRQLMAGGIFTARVRTTGSNVFTGVCLLTRVPCPFWGYPSDWSQVKGTPVPDRGRYPSPRLGGYRSPRWGEVPSSRGYPPQEGKNYHNKKVKSWELQTDVEQFKCEVREKFSGFSSLSLCTTWDHTPVKREWLWLVSSTSLSSEQVVSMLYFFVCHTLIYSHPTTTGTGKELVTKKNRKKKQNTKNTFSQFFKFFLLFLIRMDHFHLLHFKYNG